MLNWSVAVNVASKYLTKIFVKYMITTLSRDFYKSKCHRVKSINKYENMLMKLKVESPAVCNNNYHLIQVVTWYHAY